MTTPPPPPASGGRPDARQDAGPTPPAPWPPRRPGDGDPAGHPPAPAPRPDPRAAGTPSHQAPPRTPPRPDAGWQQQPEVGGWQRPAWSGPTGQPARGTWEWQPAPPPAEQAWQQPLPGPMPAEQPQPSSAAPSWPQTPQTPQTPPPSPQAPPIPPSPQAPEPGRRWSADPVGESPAVPGVRTGSPIIPPGPKPAALTAVLAALLAIASAVDRPVLVVPVVLLQALTAAGWFRLNGMWPARQGIALAFLAGLAADVGLLAAPARQAPTVIVGTLGVWILLILAQQLRHRGSADERLSSLTATAASTALTVLAAGYLAEGGRPVLLGAVAVALAVLVRALPLPQAVTAPLGLVVAVAVGWALCTPFGVPDSATAVAGAAAVCAMIGVRAASYDWPSRFVHFTAGVALPLALASPAVWAVARLLGI